MPEGLAEAMSVMNLIFTIYFVVEFLIRICGMGPDLYFSTKMNWYVSICVVHGYCHGKVPFELGQSSTTETRAHTYVAW
eukprot:scaffold241082_cov17-Tisochrysis_lutea.AAC.1